MMELQDRDFRVLLALERWGGMGLGQVDGLLFRTDDPRRRMRLFFNQLERADYWGRAYKRLSGLQKLGLVKAIKPAYCLPIFNLTPRGFELIKQRGGARFPTLRKDVSHRMAEHETTATAVGLTLSEFLGLRVETEREARHRLNQAYGKGEYKMSLPDLLVWDKEEIVHIIEVELSPKTKERYREIWKEHRSNLPGHRLSRILYLVGWPSGVEWLVRLARRFEVADIHVAPLSDFQERFGGCEFLSHYWNHDQLFTLKSSKELPELSMAKAAPAAAASPPGEVLPS